MKKNFNQLLIIGFQKALFVFSIWTTGLFSAKYIDDCFSGWYLFGILIGIGLAITNRICIALTLSKMDTDKINGLDILHKS